MITEQYRWSSGSLPAGNAFASWLDAAKGHIGDLDLESDERTGFRARFVQRSIGPVELTNIQAGQSRAERRPGRQRVAAHRYDLKYIRQGVFRVEQFGRTMEAAAGGFVLIDNNADFRFETSRAIDCICLSTPEIWLRATLPDPEACVMRPIDADSGWARALGLMLAELADLPPGDSPLPAGVVADQLAGFLTLLFQGQAIGTTSYKQQFIRSLIASIRASHQDPELTPAQIATQHRISKRYLHTLLALGGTTFGRELLAARIERAKALLGDVRYRFTAVGEIALLCGFTDPAHFTRRFKEKIGRSPSGYRAGGPGA
jgi:AraC-like DNA-binding protein